MQVFRKLKVGGGWGRGLRGLNGFGLFLDYIYLH